MSIDLTTMTTEQRNPRTMDLDTMSSFEVVRAMNREDATVPQAIEGHLHQIAQAVDWAIAALKQGGRLFYMGAGTSGRLAVCDAAECLPTFGVPPETVVGLIAGGSQAFLKAIEGAEDSRELGRNDLVERGFGARDVLVGLAASGRTPYVLGGLDYARSMGAHTVAISCNEGSEVGRAAELAIEVVVGPEVLTGSTRLKAGTAQKLILNMISTGTMVGLGKAYHNLMVDVVQTNEKLHIRAEGIVMEATGVDRKTARAAIDQASGHVKTAIVMIRAQCGADEARSRLERADGHVRQAIR